MRRKAPLSALLAAFLIVTILPYPLFAEENRPVDRGDGILENAGDWLIEEGEDFEYSDKTIIVNGNLTINGTLTLTRCYLIMNASYSTLEVPGTLNIDSTNITGNGSYYYFIVNGSLTFLDCNLSDIAGSGDQPYIGGLQVYSDEVIIEGGSITGNEFAGAYITTNITVKNLTIEQNSINLIVNGSSPQFLDCTIKISTGDSIFLFNGAKPVFVEGVIGSTVINDDASSVNYAHRLSVHVVYDNGTSIPGVNINIESYDGDFSRDVLTNDNGWVWDMILLENIVFKSQGDKLYPPYHVTVEKYGVRVLEIIPFEADTTLEIVLTGDYFGQAIVRGDFNGDRLQDLAVGVPRNLTGITIPGAVFVYFNDGGLELTDVTESIADLTIRGIEGWGFGSALSAGDINGDGFDDLMVSSPFSSENGDQAGRVHFFYGNYTVAWDDIEDAEFTLDGDPGAKFGSRLFTGNLNNDGFSDFIIGDESGSHVYYGSPDPKEEFATGQVYFVTPGAKGNEDTTAQPLVRIQLSDNVRYRVRHGDTVNNVMHVTNFSFDHIRGEITAVTMYIQFTTDQYYGYNDYEQNYLYYHVGDGWQESLRPRYNGNNWKAESTWTYNLFADGVNTKEQLQQLQCYLENIDGTDAYSSTANNIHFDFISIRVITAPLGANHTLEKGNLSSGDVNGDGYPDLIISDVPEQIIYFGGPRGLIVPKHLQINEFQGNTSGIHLGDAELSISRFGQIPNGDFESGWDNWTFMGNSQGHKNANLRMVYEEAGDWEISWYSGGPTGAYGTDGDHLNGLGGKSTGKLRTDPFFIGNDVDAITLWYRWQVISFDRNEGMNIKIYRESNDSVLRTIDTWFPSADSSRYEKEEYVTVSVADLRGETVYIAMETVGGDGGWDDGLFQIDDLDLLPYYYYHNGTFISDWIAIEESFTYYRPWWNEELNNGTISVKFRTDPGTDWNDTPEIRSGQSREMNMTSDRIQFRVDMTNNGSATPIMSDLDLAFLLEGQIIPLSLASDYGFVGVADLNGDTIDDLLFHDNQGERGQGIDIFYGNPDLSQEYNESDIQEFFVGDVSGLSVLDLESDGTNELCIIGNSIRIVDSNSDIIWERANQTNRIRDDVASDNTFHLNTGKVYFIPSHDREIRILGISIPDFIDPNKEQSIDVTVGNAGSIDTTGLTLYLNITADGYSYSDSRQFDIISMQTDSIRFLWDVPLEEGVVYTIIAEAPLENDRIPGNNNLSLDVVSKKHAIRFTSTNATSSAHGGDELVYSLTIENIGTFETENVTLEFLVPENWTGEYQSGSLPVDHIIVRDTEELSFTARSPLDEFHDDHIINLTTTAGTAISKLELTATILRPDLIIDEIQLFRADGVLTNDTIHGVANDPETIKVRITNQGPTYATGFTLTLLKGGIHYEDFISSGLISGESAWFTTSVVPEEGILNLSAVVDSADEVPEQNESNNRFDSSFIIKGVTPVGSYNITGSIQDIFGETVGFAEVSFAWNGEQENTYADENGSFLFTIESTSYRDGEPLYINATDGENMTSVRILLYSEDGGKDLLLTLNQYLVVITGPDSVSSIDINNSITIFIDVTNKGNSNATIVIEALEVPHDWTVEILDLQESRITLGIDESVPIAVEITSSGNPIFARGHQKYFIYILAYSEIYPQRNDSFTHGIEVLPLQSLHVITEGDNMTSAKPGDEVGFSFIVENHGNKRNTFIPDLLGNTVQSYEFNITFLSIEIGGQARFSLSLIAPYQISGSSIELMVGGTEIHITNAALRLTILDFYDVSCVYPPELTAAPEDILTVPLSITNTGNLQENIIISGESEVPDVIVQGGSVLLDMQQETIYSLTITIPSVALSEQKIPIIINLTTGSETFLAFELIITIREVRGISLTLMETIITPRTDFTLYSYEIEARNTGNGAKTFHFRSEGSHSDLMAVPVPTTLEPGESKMILASIFVPFNHTGVIDNYLVPMDEHDDYGDLNLRILSHNPVLDTTIEIFQEDSVYFYNISVTNRGQRFEWLKVILGIPSVDNYQFGEARWDGGADRDFLQIFPGETKNLRIWITTPELREYWGTDLTVTLISESGKSELLTLHKPPIAILGSNIPGSVTFEDILTFTGSHSLWNIIEYSWDFGDGTILNGSTVTHSFGTSGDHLVQLTVLDDQGFTASRTLPIEIDNMDPNAVIQLRPLSRIVEVDQPIKLDASFSIDRDGEIVSYLWEFGETGDFFEGMLPIIEYSYRETGSFVITLTTIDNEGHTANTTTELTVVPKTDTGWGTPDTIPEEKTTTDPMSYIPLFLIVVIILAGVVFILKKKVFIDHLIETLTEQSRDK